MKDMPFEKAMEKLEKIVGELEEGEVSLDASLKKYEEGVKLAALCHKKLESARQRIEVLTKDKNGNFSTKDLDER